MREFVVEDNNGHQLRLAEGSKESPHVARDSKPGVVIVRRLPTPAEHTSLVDAVGWKSFHNASAAEKSLPQSLFTVVAELDGACVGMTGYGASAPDTLLYDKFGITADAVVARVKELLRSRTNIDNTIYAGRA